MLENQARPARAVTRGPRHHSFGYYDKSPWDATGRYLLAMETSFADRAPEAEDVAVIGLVDTQEGNTFHPLAETQAWNWQQGTMLQWLPGAADRWVAFNIRERDHFASRLLDVRTGETRTLPLPIYAISPDGSYALSASFSRLHERRPGYGYAGVPDPYREEMCPDQIGAYHMDLRTGEHRMLFSMRQIAEVGWEETMEGYPHWFNHLQISRDGARFAFLHRWRHPKATHGNWFTRLFTANPDGSELYCLSDHGMISHYDWRDGEHILAWARRHDRGDHYYLFTDRTEQCELVGADVLPTDGHCSYSPDRRWVLTDTYPDAEHRRTLLLYDPARNRRVDLGKFYSPPELDGPVRCDLHPRWSRDGKQICFDSAHEGERQMYVMEVSEITA